MLMNFTNYHAIESIAMDNSKYIGTLDKAWIEQVFKAQEIRIHSLENDTVSISLP